MPCAGSKLRPKATLSAYARGVARSDSTSGTNPPSRPVPRVLGLHHVRVPVSDVLASRDWYAATLEFSPILVTEDEDTVTGIVMRHPSGVVLGLHRAPERAKALEGFAVVGLAVADLETWQAHLDDLGVAHSGIVDGHLGECLHVRDPDGMVVELHTPAQPSAEDA